MGNGAGTVQNPEEDDLQDGSQQNPTEDSGPAAEGKTNNSGPAEGKTDNAASFGKTDDLEEKTDLIGFLKSEEEKPTASHVKPSTASAVLTGTRAMVCICPSKIKSSESKSSEPIIDLDSNRNTVQVSKGHGCFENFGVDKVLDRAASPQDLFRHVLSPMVEKAFQGYDTVLVVLGERSSGKRELLGKSGDEDHSLYTQLFEQVFELVQNDSDSSNQHLVTAQFVEVSQEDVLTDLLALEERAASKRKPLTSKIHPIHGGYVENLSQSTVESITDLQRTYQQALMRMKNMHNNAASRSVVHLVGKINLESNRPKGREDCFTRGSVTVVEAADLDFVTSHPSYRTSHQSTKALMSRVRGNSGGGSSSLTTMVSDAFGGQSYATVLGVMPTGSLHDGGEASSAILRSLQELHEGSVENYPALKKNRQDVLLKQYKEEVNTMKKKFVKQQKLERSNRAAEINHKVGKSRNALQSRLEALKRGKQKVADTEKRSKERQIERQRKAEEAERKRKEIEAIQKMAPVIKIQEKVVEKIVEKVVEQDVIKEVRIGERPEDLALRDKLLREKELAQAERDAMDKSMLETKRKMKDLAKAEKKAKEEFHRVQFAVAGLANASVMREGEDLFNLDPTVIISRQQENLNKINMEVRNMRKVELRFKSEKKRMAQDTSRMQLALDDTNRRIDGHEQLMKSVRQSKEKMYAEMSRALKSQREEAAKELAILTDKRNTAHKEKSLLSVLIAEFLTDRELAKIQTQSYYDNSNAFWVLPDISAKTYRMDLTLKDLDGPEAQDLFDFDDGVTGDDLLRKNAVASMRAKKHSKKAKEAQKKMKKISRSIRKMNQGLHRVEGYITKAAEALQTMDEKTAKTALAEMIKITTEILGKMSKKKPSKGSKGSSKIPRKKYERPARPEGNFRPRDRPRSSRPTSARGGRPSSARPSGRPAARASNNSSKAKVNDNKAVANDEDMMQWLNEIEGGDREEASLDVPTVKMTGPAKRKRAVRRIAKKGPAKAKPSASGDADNSDLGFLDNFTYAGDKEADMSLDVSIEDQSAAVSNGK